MYFTFTRKPVRESYSGRMSIILMDSYRSNESGELRNPCLDCICSVKFISISPSWRAGEQAKGQIDTANKIGLRFLSLRRGLIVMETFCALKCLFHVCVLGQTGEGRKVREGWGWRERWGGWRKAGSGAGSSYGWENHQSPNRLWAADMHVWFWWLIATQPSSDVQEVLWAQRQLHHTIDRLEERRRGGGRGWREREMKSSDRLCLLAVRFSNSLQLLKRNLEQEWLLTF